MSIKPELVIAGLVVGVGAALLIAKVKNASSVADAGSAVGAAAVNVVDAVGSGVIVGIGGIVGIPKTNLDECEQAIAEGRTWDASFACPAKRFITYLAK